MVEELGIVGTGMGTGAIEMDIGRVTGVVGIDGVFMMR